MKLMNENYNNLEKDVINSILSSDTEKFKLLLMEIKGNTIVTGVGGSRVVATFLKKILDTKEHINTLLYIDDLVNFNFDNYENIILCSFSGKGTPKNMCLNNKLKKYIISNNVVKKFTSLNYESIKRKSFISLSSTLIPISLLLYCYLGKTKDEFISIIKDMFASIKINYYKSDIYEIFYNRNSNTSLEYLESTMVESGIAIPIVHDLYSYCHGRSTTQKNINSAFIYLGEDTDLDKVLKDCFKQYEKKVIYLNNYSNDNIVNDYYKLLQAMFLTKIIAENKKVDLANIKYSPMVKNLFHFKGSM